MWPLHSLCVCKFDPNDLTISNSFLTMVHTPTRINLILLEVTRTMFPLYTYCKFHLKVSLKILTCIIVLLYWVTLILESPMNWTKAMLDPPPNALSDVDIEMISFLIGLA